VEIMVGLGKTKTVSDMAGGPGGGGLRITPIFIILFLYVRCK